MKRLYYYVPSCPVCGNKRTGRYIKTPISNARQIKESALRAGEIIRFAGEEPLKNAFCLSCGHEWPTRIRVRLLSSDAIAKEKRDRGISEEYDRLAAKKHPKQKNGFFSSLFSFSQEDRSEKVAEVEQRQEFDIVDARKKNSLTLLYADEEMINKLKGKSYDTI